MTEQPHAAYDADDAPDEHAGEPVEIDLDELAAEDGR